jgi:hypothetical protein
MSNEYEPAITLAYWRSLPISGKLYLEYPVEKLGYVGSKRRIDGVVVIGRNGDKAGHPGKSAPALNDLKGKSVLLIQTKRRKLGMGLAGQAIVTKKLFEHKKLKVEASVALCLKDDPDISLMLEALGCTTYVYPTSWGKASRK